MTAADPTPAPAPPGEYAIHTEGLAKSYGRVAAVRGVDLRVRPGEMFGFLGPNGAGKTTTISMLCTLTRPTAGRAFVAGADVAREPHTVRHGIGLVFQASTLDEDLTGVQTLRFHGELYGLSRRCARGQAERVLRLVGLAGHGRALVRTFSGGMRRRLEIGRALMHVPRVLVLDEPTVGLDPQSRAVIWESLHALRREHGLTLFLTTHQLQEAERCDRVAIIDAGRVVAEGSPERLKSVVGADRVELRADDPVAAARRVRDGFGLEAVADGDVVRVRAGNGEGAALVPRLCAHLGPAVRSVSVARPSLDDVFLHYTGRTIRDEEATTGDRLRAAAPPPPG